MPSDISNYLNQIRTAVYGREVREAIANGIEQCYNDTSNGVTLAETKLGELDDAVASLNEAVENASEAIETANGASATAQELNTALGNNAKDLVLVQNEQPNKEFNKIWVDPDVEEHEVPTYQELSDLKSAFDTVTDLGSTLVFATDFEKGYRHERPNCSLVANANYVITKQPIQFYAGQVVSIASGYGLQFVIVDANPSNNGAYVCTRRSAPCTITADIQAYVEVRYEAASTAISASTAEEKVTITTDYPIVKTASDAYNRAMKIIKYVATTGNDTNSGNSSSEPYATIGKALTELADEIYIKPGTYTENLGEVNTGYRYRNVKIVGDHVILQSNVTLHFRFCNVEIVGIYFDHQATSGEIAALHLYNCTGRVADCVADGCPGNGFRFDGSRLTVERCIAMNCGIDGFNGHTLTTGYETEITLIDCIAHDNGDDGASVHESGKMYVIGGEYYSNAQTGLAPHDLCEFEALNVHCHNNGIGIEAIKDTLSEGQTPAVGRVIGCILNNNDTYGLDVKNYTVNTLGNGYASNGSGNTNAGTGATINAFVVN